MLYLLYLRNGFIKKFPLNKKKISFGRAKSSDFQLDEPFVSKEHAKIIMGDDIVEIFDLNSTNGVFSEKGKIKNGTINLNQYFRVGHIKFYLKKGNSKELILSEKIQPKLNKVFNSKLINNDKTVKMINHLYSEQLAEIFNIGFGLPNINEILEFSKDLLQKTLVNGTLLIVSKDHKKNKIISKWNCSSEIEKNIDIIIGTLPLFNKPYLSVENEKGFHYCSFPFDLNFLPTILIYISPNGSKIPDYLEEFIEILSIEISIIDNLIKQNRTEKIKVKSHFEIITVNPELNNLLAQSKKIAGSNLSILIEGETGTGKELLAKYIHQNSKNDKNKFIALNCSAIPENLMEAELFGYEKGAFTDATSQRKGKLELASGGTLVLDEIGDMPLNLQAKLLRAVQEEEFYSLGGTTPINVKLRIISMTNKNISELMKNNLFRQDLYYRIAHVVLKIPSIRDRKEDIIPLINHFIEKHSKIVKIVIKGFSNQAIKALEMYGWPGNIRELENEIVKLLNLAENNDMIILNMLKDEIKEFYKKNESEIDPSINEKQLIMKLLEENKWNKSIVAAKLKISRTALYNKLKKHSIHLQ